MHQTEQELQQKTTTPQMLSDKNVAVVLEHEGCKVVEVAGSDGEGVMTAYQVLDGIHLIYNDFHMTEFSSDRGNVVPMLCISHCREGRMEMRADNGAAHYMEKGDLRIENRYYHRGSCYFPLSHYHGIIISFEEPRASESLRREMPGFAFDLQALIDKFCAEDKPFVIRGEESVEHLFQQLYQLPGRVPREYFKVKVLELLVYLSGMELAPYKVDRPYFYNRQIEKVRAIHAFITSDLSRNDTLEELSERFDISLTAMKQCFKSTYGSPVYTYLKKYRMRKAAELLVMRPELRVSEIGAMVGYESPSKFTAAFHQLMNETPLQYRKSHGGDR